MGNRRALAIFAVPVDNARLSDTLGLVYLFDAPDRADVLRDVGGKAAPPVGEVLRHGVAHAMILRHRPP